MTDVASLQALVESKLQNYISNIDAYAGQLTIEVPADHLIEICHKLYYERDLKFDMLMDLCGVDYLCYGVDEWIKQKATRVGFSRGVVTPPLSEERTHNRFAVVYHLLSVTHNHRIRVRTYPQDDPPIVDSVIDIWASANWFEREAFDLFGILFRGHPDLRRILTDYGFIGHPFRKDFPLIGNVEMRYDAGLQRCVYEKVSIQPRTLVPKVIRKDHRYIVEADEELHRG